MDSFESPLDVLESAVSVDADSRLVGSSSVEDATGADAIDRDIHNAINQSSSVGMSTNQNSSQNIHDDNNMVDQMDLENQSPALRLTKTQRVMNVFYHLVPIKQTYDRISNGLVTGRMQSNVPGRFIGQGTDGVFRNLMAKPDTNAEVVKNETHPPSYEEAAADATPEYWETSVIAPIYDDEVFVEGLPVGNIANFVWNALVTVAFQFVGFLLCYLLHTSHAAKHGSRAGLGITFILYGWDLVPANFGSSSDLPVKYEPKNPNNYNIDINSPIDEAGIDDFTSELTLKVTEETVNTTPYIAYGLIAFGLLMILKAFVDYFRVKQMEKVILHPPSNSSPSITTGESEVTWEQQESSSSR